MYMKLNNNLLNIKNIHSTSETDIYSANRTNVEIQNAIKDVYSTSEVKTNKVWIDNKPIYRKVIYNANTLTYSNNKAIINTGISNISNLVKMEALALDQYNGWFNLPFANITNVEYQISIQLNGSNLEIETNTYQTRLTKYAITLEYTKTTD